MKIDFDIKKFVQDKNNSKILIGLCFVGILLIVFSDVFFDNDDNIYEIVDNAEEVSIYDLGEYYEGKLKSIISDITGESDPGVMITFSSSEEYVYAVESSIKESYDGESSEKESEENYIILENDDGEEALLITVIDPKIEGVIIVTKYAGNVNIKEDIINSVTKVFNISSNDVSVVTKNK